MSVKNEKMNGRDKWLAMITALALYIVFAGMSALGFYAALSSGSDTLLTWVVILFATATIVMAAMMITAISIFQKSRRALVEAVYKFMEVLPEDERESVEKLAAGDETALAEKAVAWYLQKHSEVNSLRFANSAALAEIAMSRDISFEIGEKQQHIHFGTYWNERYGVTVLDSAKRVDKIFQLETQIAFNRAVETAKQAIGTPFTVKGRIQLDSQRTVSVVISGASTVAYDQIIVLGVIRDVQSSMELREGMSVERKKFAFLLENTEDIIYETDVEQNKLTVLNPERSMAVFGMGTLTDFDNGRRPYWEFIHPDYREGFVDRFINYDHLMILPGRRLSYEYRVKNINGDYIWVEHTICAVSYEKSRALKIIGRIKDINLAKREELRIVHNSSHDSLTGALVRSVITREVNKAITDEPERKRAMLLFNINGFKHVNHQYGMEIGDKTLRAVVKELWAVQSGPCKVGKASDDTFVFVILEPTEENSPENLLKKLYKVMNEPLMVGTTLMNVTLSCGYAFYPDDGKDFDEMFESAQTALYVSRWKNEPYSNNALAYTKEMNEEKAKIDAGEN